MDRFADPLGPPPALVLDTNAVLDWQVFGNPAMTPVIDAVRAGTVRWWATAAMRVELERVLTYKNLARYAPDAAAVLAAWDALAQVVEPPLLRVRPRCTDADDQGFIDLALARQARWLISRDRAVLKLARRARSHGLWIGVPEAWPALAGPALA